MDQAELDQPKRLKVGIYALLDDHVVLEPKKHVYTYANPRTGAGEQFPSVSEGLDTVFQTFDEFTREVLTKVPSSRRTLRATLKASGPMGSRVHAYLAK